MEVSERTMHIDGDEAAALAARNGGNAAVVVVVIETEHRTTIIKEYDSMTIALKCCNITE